MVEFLYDMKRKPGMSDVARNRADQTRGTIGRCSTFH